VNELILPTELQMPLFWEPKADSLKGET